MIFHFNNFEPTSEEYKTNRFAKSANHFPLKMFLYLCVKIFEIHWY